MEKEINLHWFPEGGYLVSNLNPPGGLGDRPSNLDSSVILAINHTEASDKFFAPNDERVLATAAQLKRTFQSIYNVNSIVKDHRDRPLSPAIGRYPEDTYNGHGNSQGNPWFLLTYAFGEFNYRLAKALSEERIIAVTPVNLSFYRDLPNINFQVRPGDRIASTDSRFQAIINSIVSSGDGYVSRSLYHSGGDGSMNEQFYRDSGYMTGVPDLTWGYASIFTATWARERIFQR
jgi:glucoamylase